MKVSVGKADGNKLGFTVSGMSMEMANVLRRYGMMSVPTFAVENVTFYENTSSLFDEYLSHRIGLIPLTTPAKTPKEAEVVFVIDEVGPKVVYAEDMKSDDKDVKVARGKIPIITLNPEQKLRLEAKALPGIGRTHAKHQAGLLSYAEKDDTFTFKVESFWQMDPDELVLRACDVVLDELDELKKGLKKKKKE